MVTVIMTFDISKSYAEWKSVYDGASHFISDAGFEVVYVGHTLEDERKCYWIVRVQNMDALDAFMNNEVLQPIMLESGHILESTQIVACSA